MACDYVFLQTANEELEEISDYILGQVGSSRVLDDWVNQLEMSISLICENPQMHPISYLPELAEKGYRTTRVGSYVLLYTVSGETVFIEHIFHYRRDYAHLV